MFIARDFYCLIIWFAIDAAVELSVVIFIGGCACPICSSACFILMPSCELRNNAVNSSSTADEYTSLINVHKTWMRPFFRYGF